MPQAFAPDYIEVADRIAEFYQRFPEGAIQTEILEFTADKVTIRALAYRRPDDPRPGTGHSSLAIPGATPYTRGSELENCETSAVGRAIVMVGIPARKVASADEVRAKVPELAALGDAALSRPEPTPIRRPKPKPEFTFTDQPEAAPPLPPAPVPAPADERMAAVWDGLGLPRIPEAKKGAMCPKHPGERWGGTPGDLFHRWEEAGKTKWCRPDGQSRKGSQK